jgi:hypothetical protein
MVEHLSLVQLHLLAVGVVEIVQEELLLRDRQEDLAAAVHGEPLITPGARLHHQDRVTPVGQEKSRLHLGLAAAVVVRVLLAVVTFLETMLRLAAQAHLLTRHGVQRLAQDKT